MAKFCLKKPSKRIPARKRYKIEKKVREHNRKMRKEAKKKQKGKPKVIEIPNQCPFKEDILKEVEAMKKHNEEEKQKQREATKEKKRAELAKNGLQGLVKEAQKKADEHEAMEIDDNRSQLIKDAVAQKENSLKAYYKEFKKVLDAADVILEVVDARDPLGTRCKQLEEAVHSAKGNKRLVIVLNKADLVPRENLNKWLKYLRGSLPAVAFKSSTQDQSKKLGRRKLGKKTENMIQSGTCFGAELLLSLLANYCRNSSNVKTSIRVGVAGLPNVGKSSVINSLKRSRACNVGSVPGVTRAMQVVQLDSKIKLLDSPGIVFASKESSIDGMDDTSIALKNAIRIQALQDPYTPATAILRRLSKQQVMDLYDVPEYNSPDEFFALRATRMGKFKRGGVPNQLTAARCVLEDWNSGKIRYYTEPPEEPLCHLSAEIVSQMAKEFDIESFAAEERMMLDDVEAANKDITVEPVLFDSTGPVTSVMEVEIEKDKKFKIQNKLKKKLEAKPKVIKREQKKKTDPQMELEGNQKLNKLQKLQFKKEKKEKARREKATSILADQLEGFNLSSSDNYDFNTDFTK